MNKDNDNGGYSEDKKAIEQALAQNKTDHDTIIGQNEKDHKAIMDQNDRDHDLLKQIQGKYIPDVIVMQTKINIFSVILMIFLVPTVALAYKFIESWFRGK